MGGDDDGLPGRRSLAVGAGTHKDFGRILAHASFQTWSTSQSRLELWRGSDRCQLDHRARTIQRAVALMAARIAPVTLSTDLVTLDNCEREPIHVPGSIQPHGALIAFDVNAAMVLHASTNLGKWLSVADLPSHGRFMSDLLGTAGFERVKQALTGAASNAIRHRVIDLPARPHDGQPQALEAVVHMHRGVCMLELVPVGASDDADWMQSFGDTIDSLRNADDLDELIASMTRCVKRVTAFDRVMVYRFDADWNGHVVADVCEPGMESLQDLHYPASDIPAQARDLYCSNLVRYIADVNYVPVPVLPLIDSERQQRLDMSHAMLRSVSPMHLQYLRNMNVGATLTISLVSDGRLWGLIACHHRVPREVPVRLWRACHALAVTAGYMVSSYEQRERAGALVALAHAQSRVLEAFNLVAAPLDDVIDQCSGSLMRAAGAFGGAFWRDGRVIPFGRWPAGAQGDDVVLLARRELETSTTDVWCSDAAPLPRATGVQPLGSVYGILALRLDAFASSGIAWVRPEFKREVSWGGDPAKPVVVTTGADGMATMSPRTSFERWLTVVKGHSRPWSDLDLAGARLLLAVAPVLAMRESLAQVSLSDRRFRGLVALQSDAYCQLDIEGRLMTLSKPLPTGQRAVEGESLVALFAPCCDAVEVAAFDTALRSRIAFRDFRLHGSATAECPEFVVDISGEPLRDHYGDIVGWHGTITDATLRSAMQKALRLKEAAEMSSLAKSKFLSQMSHELRTPLNAVLGFSYLSLADKNISSKHREHLEQIQRSGKWLLEMIGDLMDLSRIEGGYLPLNMIAVDLGPVVEDVIAMLGSLSGASVVALTNDSPDKHAWVLADAVRMKQVLVNLVSNGIKYNRAKGHVWISIQVDEAAGTTRVDVRDDGDGLTATQQAQLFQSFNRLGRESHAIEGSGIGLVIVKQLVEAMGGQVSVESDVGCGSVFSVTLVSAADPGLIVLPKLTTPA